VWLLSNACSIGIDGNDWYEFDYENDGGVE
jgi:hypothetical protein